MTEIFLPPLASTPVARVEFAHTLRGLAAISGFIMAIVLACVLHWIVGLPTMRFGKHLAKKLFPKDFSTHG